MSSPLWTSGEARSVIDPDISLAERDALLAAVGLRNVRQAWEYLNDCRFPGGDESWREVLPRLVRLLGGAPNPDAVLVQWARLFQGAPDPIGLLDLLRQEPRGIETLVRLFVGSQYLSEILISNPGYLAGLIGHRRLAELRSREQFLHEAQTAVSTVADENRQWDALRRYQRWELLRIGLCDSFGMVDLRTTTVQLSLLADALVQSCLDLATRKSEGSGAGLAILALGKLGGEELNYSSDIDLVFLAEEQPESYWQIAQRVVRGLNHATGAGFLYRVDLRLRPWGQAGPLVSSLNSYFEYLQSSAELWERQALLKARVIAGDFQVGQRFLDQLPQYLFEWPDEVLRKQVRETKQRIEAGQPDRQRGLADVKLGVGSIRDVEFVTQYLQLRYGGPHCKVRSCNTLDALVRLAEADFLPANEYRILSEGYVFLRKVEHALQLLQNKQTHTLPQDPHELELLALRLDFPSVELFQHHHQQHRALIREVYQRHLEEPRTAHAATPTRSPAQRLAARMDQHYSAAFSHAEIEAHAAAALLLDDEHLMELQVIPLSDGTWRVTIVAFDYLGELSLICGLLFEYGFDILAGQVFTSHSDGVEPAESGGDTRQKIVDVFHVRHQGEALSHDVWDRYRTDLKMYLGRLHRGDQKITQGELAKRVASAIEQTTTTDTPLYPVEIEVDNSTSERYTLLRIRGQDTSGFLYELTHALALHGVSIRSVSLQTQDGIAFDMLWVTDAAGRKITGETQLHQLRAAVVLTKHFTHLLPHSSNPASALMHFREFITQLFTRPDWPSEFASLEQTEVLDALARLLGVSDFLWNDFLRMQHENLFPVVKDVAVLGKSVSREELQQQLAAGLSGLQGVAQQAGVLEAIRDREMFRVDMRHILRHIPEFGQFSRELCDIVEVIVVATWNLCWDTLTARFGQPLLDNGEPCPFSVCALGKCGGRELGFASDIELMFLFGGSGQTTGPEVISNLELGIKLVERFMQLLKTRREGIFQIDLRLRPYGRGGDVAVAFVTFCDYFAPDGPAWPYERQALVKLRPLTGNEAFGQKLTAARDRMLYTGTPFDLQAIRGMRERQRQQLVTAGTINAKFSAGGLVDVEYFVQALQITHGHAWEGLRVTNTLAAIEALRNARVIAAEMADGLRDAYIFSRQLIDGLRMVRGDARDLTVPPVDSEDFRFLSRRLGYIKPSALVADLERHLARVVKLIASANI